MIAVIAGVPAPGRTSRSRRALVGVEARRSLTAPWLWIGIVTSAWFSFNSATSSWAGDGYRGLMSSSAGIAAGLFVLGVQAGGRDHTPDGPVAAEAPTGPDGRALARLIGIWPAWAVAVLFAGIGFLVQRLEGGMWIADWPGGVTDGVFSVVEMLQPPVLFAVTASAGVAIGRATAHRSIASIAGALVILAAGLVYWAWQWTPGVWVTLIQTQPIEVRLESGFAPTEAPASWMLSMPDEFNSDWGHVMVHQAMAAWHLVYLLGLVVIFAGLAVRGRRGRMAVVTGLLVAALGIAAQVVVTPSGLVGA